MPGSWLPQGHPHLDEDSCTVTSPISPLYNCIAWAAGDTRRWWWPAARRGVSYWPRGVPRETTLQSFIQAFETLGFALCADHSLEPGIEKVAIYRKIEGGRAIPTHAAFQLESGQWTSKMGSLEDIIHDTVDGVNGPTYGEPAAFLSRPRQPRPSADLDTMHLHFS